MTKYCEDISVQELDQSAAIRSLRGELLIKQCELDALRIEVGQLRKAVDWWRDGYQRLRKGPRYEPQGDPEGKRQLVRDVIRSRLGESNECDLEDAAIEYRVVEPRKPL
jgi:hypothetical protein